MILQMQTQVDNQVKTMFSHITEDHIYQMSSHINTKCENDASHQNPGPGQHQHGALKLLLTSCYKWGLVRASYSSTYICVIPLSGPRLQGQYQALAVWLSVI